MAVIPLLCIVSLAFTGLTKGAGVLPHDSLDASVGDTIIFSTTLTPSSGPLAHVEWKFGSKLIFLLNGPPSPEYKDRINLTLSTGSLELRNLTLNDSGEYIIQILIIGSPIMSGKTTLNVYVPVSNVEVSVSARELVESNSSVSAFCSSFGSSPSFLWLNSSSEVTASDRVHITDGGSNLTIVNVTRYDQGPFKCRVYNPISNDISSPLHLTINYGPEKTMLISPQQYYERGSNVTLSCNATSEPPAAFSWFLNGDNLAKSGPELNLYNLQEDQSGNYSCKAFNAKTMRYDTSQPSGVHAIDSISSVFLRISTNNMTEGNALNVTCEAVGSVFTRVWYKDDKQLTETDNMRLYNNSRVLAFLSLSKRDIGDYLCRVSNPISADGERFRLYVKYGPHDIKIQGPTQIKLEEELLLQCSSDSEPPASYQWIFNGSVIENRSVLFKVVHDFSDSGNYTCQAWNFVTGRTRSAARMLSVVGVGGGTASRCDAGCIAGIVIACIVIIAVIGAIGGYCIYKKKKLQKKSNGNTATTAQGSEGQNNTTYSGQQELHYEDVRFVQDKDRGNVQLGLQKTTTEYAEIRVNNNTPPPPYGVHIERLRAEGLQPDANAAPLYAQVCKK